MSIDPAPARPTILVTGFLWSALLLSTGLILLVANRGLGLTDESFYLGWIADPDRYAATVSGFAFPLHLMFEALGRSITALRAAGILLLVGSGGLLGWALERYYASIAHPLPRGAFIALGALTALSYYALWVLTPSYNLLANVAAALLLSGGLMWSVADRSSRLDWRPAAILLGTGGGLAFLSRPPLAAVGAAAAMVLIVRTMRRHGIAKTLPSVLLTGAACLIFLLLMIEGTVGLLKFAGMIRFAQSFFFPEDSILHVPIKAVREVLARRAFSVTAAVFVLAVVVNGTDRLRGNVVLRQMLILFNAGICALCLYQLYKGYVFPLKLWSFIGIPLGTMAVALCSTGVALQRRRIAAWPVYPPIVCLIAMPFAIGLGSIYDNASQTGAATAGFLLAAAVGGWLFFRPRPASMFLVGCAAATCAILMVSSFRPYGETEPVADQVHRVTLGHNILYVSRDHQQFIDGLRRIAEREHLSSATPVIDLSSGGPGTAFVLDGNRPLVPWIYPTIQDKDGYQGRIADAAFDSLSRPQRDAAWIIGPIRREFRYSRLARFLGAAGRCYRRAGTLRTVIWSEAQAISVWVPDRACLEEMHRRGV